MKAIMYHYVRPDEPSLPFFRHLDIDNFVRQLELLGDKYGFMTAQEFEDCISSGRPGNGVVLTFDDGFKDHYRYVLPELLKRGLWAIFYIPTSPYFTGKLIDVHRLHMLLGRYGGEAIAGALRGIIRDDMLSHTHVKAFHTETYKEQDNDASTNYVKRLVNFFIDYRHRQSVVDELMSMYYPNESGLVDDFYMTPTELAEMAYSGMLLGSHTVNHRVMSRLTPEQQEEEIASSFEVIEGISNRSPVKTFCYPHGGSYSFTPRTEQILEQSSCLFSFNVEPRDITAKDLARRRQALPRFDCNQFPHGSCRTGIQEQNLTGSKG